MAGRMIEHRQTTKLTKIIQLLLLKYPAYQILKNTLKSFPQHIHVEHVYQGLWFENTSENVPC